MSLNELSIKQNKAILIADIHFGVRAASEEWQQNISDYFYKWFIPFIKKLKNKKDYSLFVLGDVFDNRNAINIEVNNLAINVFNEIASIIPIFIINGNHDLYRKTNKGVSSLKTFESIKNITVIQEPTLLNLGLQEDSTSCAKAVAIPYLGDQSEEGKILIKNKTCDYAFMHTDIAHMKYDSIREITAGVNVKSFKGKIFSGHIHIRQEMKNVTYIGSPYHMNRSDIGNQKGIYILDFKNKTQEFVPNNYSPVFQKIFVDDFLNMDPKDRSKLIDNNYNDILIPKKDFHQYKLSDIYDIINDSNAKRVSVNVIDTEQDSSVYSEDEVKIISIDELINNSIDSLDVDELNKQHLKDLSFNYLKAAKAQIEND